MFKMLCPTPLLVLVTAALQARLCFGSPISNSANPSRQQAVNYVETGNSQQSHPIADYDQYPAFGVDDDEDLRNFRAVIYGDEDPRLLSPAGEPTPQYTFEEQNLLDGIPQGIATSPAAQEFDEDLDVLKLPVAAGAVESHGTPQQNPESSFTSDKIPASEIAADFPEYREPKTFNTERVDYNIRTNNPTASDSSEPSGEDNSNVAVFNADKSFHWSGGNGDSLPKNDPEFRQAMSFITGKIRPGGKARGKGRAGKTSVFDVLTQY